VSSRALLGFVAAGIVGFVLLRPGGEERWAIRNDRPGRGPIVCFGDSLTSGFGAERSQSYPAVLQSLLGREVVNRGRNGDTTAASLERIDDVLSLEPSVVIVTLGGNDMLQRVPIQETVAAMRGIFDRLIAAGSMVVFLGIDPPLASSARMDAIRQLCRERGVLWVGHAMDGLWGDRTRMSDQIHPNAAGYRAVAERVAEALRPRL
jgi:lysophospholipase L1-like esterase